MNKLDREWIAEEESDIQPRDLYYTLHHVGDDTTKAEIEATLKLMLDAATFNRVVAVFKWCTKP